MMRSQSNSRSSIVIPYFRSSPLEGKDDDEEEVVEDEEEETEIEEGKILPKV